jgi:hypothetical protein
MAVGTCGSSGRQCQRRSVPALLDRPGREPGSAQQRPLSMYLRACAHTGSCGFLWTARYEARHRQVSMDRRYEFFIVLYYPFSEPVFVESLNSMQSKLTNKLGSHVSAPIENRSIIRSVPGLFVITSNDVRGPRSNSTEVALTCSASPIVIAFWTQASRSRRSHSTYRETMVPFPCTFFLQSCHGHGPCTACNCARTPMA